MPHCDVHASGCFAFFSEFDIELLDHISVFLSYFWLAFLFGILDVAPQKLSIKSVKLLRFLFEDSSVQIIDLLVGMVGDVRVDDESAEMEVQFFVDFVFDHVQDIESGENGVRKVNILAERKSGVVPSIERICSCYN